MATSNSFIGCVSDVDAREAREVGEKAARHRDDVMNVAGGMDAWLDAGLPAATCPVSHEHTSPTPPTGKVPETRKTRNRLWPSSTS